MLKGGGLSKYNLQNFFAHGPIKCKWFLKKSILPVYWTLMGTTSQGLSRPGSNAKISCTGASQFDETLCHTKEYTFVGSYTSAHFESQRAFVKFMSTQIKTFLL